MCACFGAWRKALGGSNRTHAAGISLHHLCPVSDPRFSARPVIPTHAHPLASNFPATAPSRTPHVPAGDVGVGAAGCRRCCAPVSPLSTVSPVCATLSLQPVQMGASKAVLALAVALSLAACTSAAANGVRGENSAAESCENGCEVVEALHAFRFFARRALVSLPSASTVRCPLGCCRCGGMWLRCLRLGVTGGPGLDCCMPMGTFPKCR